MVIFMKTNPKSNHISKSAFKSQHIELFKKPKEDEKPIIITYHGKPILEIRRYPDPLALNAFETLRGSVLNFENPTDPIWDGD